MLSCLGLVVFVSLCWVIGLLFCTCGFFIFFCSLVLFFCILVVNLGPFFRTILLSDMYDGA